MAIIADTRKTHCLQDLLLLLLLLLKSTLLCQRCMT
jgi:hypothetical protein